MRLDNSIVLDSFTKACDQLQDPKTRLSAEATIRNIKSRRQSITLFRYFLESTNSNQVQYHACKAIQGAIGVEFDHYKIEDVLSLQHFLVEYSLMRTELPPFVRDAVLQTAAITSRRIISRNYVQECENILNVFNQLVRQGIHQQTVALRYMYYILEELGFDVNSSPAGLSIDTILRIKQAFTEISLPTVWSIIMDLTQASLNDASIDDQIREFMLVNQLSVADKVLNWNFAIYQDGTPKPRTLFLQETIVDSDATYTLTVLPESWRGGISNQHVMSFFSAFAFLMSRNSERSSLSGQIILALSGLSGPAQPKEISVAYFSNFAQLLSTGLSQLCANISAPQVSSILYLLASAAVNLMYTNRDITPSLFEHDSFWELCHTVCRTIFCIHDFISSRPLDEDADDWVWAVDEKLFDFWAKLSIALKNNDALDSERTKSLIIGAMVPILENFISIRIQVACAQVENERDGVEHDLDIEDEDWDSQENILKHIATVSQMCADPSLKNVTNILRECVQVYQEHSGGGDPALHEKTHWALTISGYVIYDEEREKFTTSTGIAEFTSQLFNLFETIGPDTSSQVVQTLWWCLKQWAHIFAADSTDKELISQHIPNICRILVLKIAHLFRVWAVEEKLLFNMLAAISILCRNTAVSECIGRVPEFAEMVNLWLYEYMNIPEKEQRHLFEVMTVLCDSLEPNMGLALFNAMKNKACSNISDAKRLFIDEKNTPGSEALVANVFQMSTGITDGTSMRLLHEITEFLKEPLLFADFCGKAFHQDSSIFEPLWKFIYCVVNLLDSFNCPLENMVTVLERVAFQLDNESKSNLKLTLNQSETFEDNPAYMACLVLTRILKAILSVPAYASDSSSTHIEKLLNPCLVQFIELLDESVLVSNIACRAVSDLLLAIVQCAPLTIFMSERLYGYVTKLLLDYMNTPDLESARNIIHASSCLAQYGLQYRDSQDHHRLQGTLEQMLLKLFHILIFEKSNDDLFEAYAEAGLPLVYCCADTLEDITRRLVEPFSHDNMVQSRIVAGVLTLKNSIPPQYPQDDESIESLVEAFRERLYIFLSQARIQTL